MIFESSNKKSFTILTLASCAIFEDETNGAVLRFPPGNPVEYYPILFSATAEGTVAHAKTQNKRDCGNRWTRAEYIGELNREGA